jgi:hypothetical protein
MTVTTKTVARAKVRERRARDAQRGRHRGDRAAELGRVAGFGSLLAYWWALGNNPEGALELMLSLRPFWTSQQRAAFRKAIELASDDDPVMIPTVPMLLALTRWFIGLRFPENEAGLFAGPALIERQG